MDVIESNCIFNYSETHNHTFVLIANCLKIQYFQNHIGKLNHLY